MALASRILPNYTYADYILWEGEWEIIDGIPYAMSPMPSPRHQRLANKLGVQFDKEIERKNCNCQVYQPIDLKISEETVVHPDLLVVCRPIEKQFLDFPPSLVVEILSPSTKLKDEVTKLELYQDFGIRYYLIVDSDTNKIIYYQLEGDKYKEMDDSKELFLDEDCQLSPDLGAIW